MSRSGDPGIGRTGRPRLPAAGGLLLSLCCLLPAACGSPDRDRPAEERPLAITGVTVYDGLTSIPLHLHTVLIRGRRIELVGPTETTRIPADSRIVDGRGKFLIPGLWDMHVHLSKARASALPLFLVHGVTGVRDMGGDFAEVSRWRREIEAGERLGPRILTAGPYLEAPANVERMLEEGVVEPVERTRVPVPDPRAARRVVDSLAREGVDFIKVRTVADLDTYLAIGSASDSAGLPLAGHTLGIRPDDILRAGQESIEHFLFPLLDDLEPGERMRTFQELALRGVVVVPTMVTWADAFLVSPDTLRAIVEDTAGRREPRRRYVARYLVEDWREQVAEMAAGDAEVDWEAVYRSTLRNLREMSIARVQLLAGTDLAVVNVYPGSSLHREIELLAGEVGLSRRRAILAATGWAAEAAGVADSLGTIEPGKLADLVLLEGDPYEDVSNVRRIRAVVYRGELYDRQRLDALRELVADAPELRENDWR